MKGTSFTQEPCYSNHRLLRREIFFQKHISQSQAFIERLRSVAENILMMKITWLIDEGLDQLMKIISRDKARRKQNILWETATIDG